MEARLDAMSDFLNDAYSNGIFEDYVIEDIRDGNFDELIEELILEGHFDEAVLRRYEEIMNNV